MRELSRSPREKQAALPWIKFVHHFTAAAIDLKCSWASRPQGEHGAQRPEIDPAIGNGWGSMDGLTERVAS